MDFYATVRTDRPEKGIYSFFWEQSQAMRDLIRIQYKNYHSFFEKGLEPDEERYIEMHWGDIAVGQGGEEGS